MDYEKLYKEALDNLNRIKNESPEWWREHEKTMQEIFPGFFDTEDERIREALIKLVKKAGEGYQNVIDGVSIENAIAWLEKQGKNNIGISEATKQKLEDNLNKALEQETPNSWNKFLKKQGEQKTADKVESKFKVGDVIRLKGGAAEYTIKRVTDTTYYTNGWSCGIERCEKDYELVEQKPVDKVEPKFKVGDEIRTKNKESLIITRIDRWGYWSEDLFICNFDNADKWELVEQKPAEWSKEDEKMLNKLLAVVALYFGYTGNVLDKQSCTSFLKSLKDRVGCEADCTTTWKPSEGQLECLGYAIDKAEHDFSPLVTNRIYLTLKGLREQLEKLAE